MLGLRVLRANDCVLLAQASAVPLTRPVADSEGNAGEGVAAFRSEALGAPLPLLPGKDAVPASVLVAQFEEAKVPLDETLAQPDAEAAPLPVTGALRVAGTPVTLNMAL